MPQRDILLRWLHQVSLVIRRLLYGPGEVDIELAEAHIDEAFEQHLGALEGLVERVDPPSAAELLHDPDRIFGYAQLTGLKAAVYQSQGKPQADELKARALALGRLAIERSQETPVEWEAWLKEAEKL